MNPALTKEWPMALSLLPTAALLGLAALFLQGRHVLGVWPKGMHWAEGQFFPTASNLDPGRLGWTYVGIGMLVLLAWTSMVLWLPYRLLSGGACRFERIVGPISAVIWLGVIWADPMGVWNWFLD